MKNRHENYPGHAVIASAAAAFAAIAVTWPQDLPLHPVGAVALMPPGALVAQGAGIGKEGEGVHKTTGQGGGGLGASGSGPQGSGAQGDSHAPAGTDEGTRGKAGSNGAKGSSDRHEPSDSNSVTGKDVERLYTPPPQDRAAPANAEKPAR